MALRAIEGNRTHLFDSGSTGCQVLNGLGCNQRQSISPVRLGQRRMPSTSWPGGGQSGQGAGGNLANYKLP